jgi:hypothetical protein
MDKETVLLFTGSDDSEQFHPVVILWGKTVTLRLSARGLLHQLPMGQPRAVNYNISFRGGQVMSLASNLSNNQM